MNLEQQSGTDGCIVQKNPPSFYYDSGLEDNIYQDVQVSIDHELFESVCTFRFTGEINHHFDDMEKYQCCAYTVGKDAAYRLDFRFTLYKSKTNNTYYVDNDEVNRFLQYPTDFGGTIDYYFIDNILPLLFFLPPKYEDICY